MWSQAIITPDRMPLWQWQGLRILPGLNAVTGDEGSGKTRLLQQLATAHADALWLDLRLPGHDAQTPPEVWQSLLASCPAGTAPGATRWPRRWACPNTWASG